MNLFQQNKRIVALIYSVYFSAFLFLFDTMSFLGDSTWVQILIVYVTLFVGVLFFLMQLDHKNLPLKSRVRYTLWFLPVFSMVLATSFIVVQGIEFIYVLPYLTSFIILTLPPIVIVVLFTLFDQLKDTVYFVEKKVVELSLKKIDLENENGKVFLSIFPHQLICFESNDNYVITYYINDEEKLIKTMDRQSLRKLEEQLTQHHVAFERVHKSYVINPNYVLKIKGKSQAYRLEMKYLSVDVPVSRNFDVSILK